MLFKFSCSHRLEKDFYRYQIYTGPAVVTLVGKLCSDNGLVLPLNSTGLTKTHHLGLVLDWNRKGAGTELTL